MKIYVAGHRGLVGSAIVRNIETVGVHKWVGASRSELDLLDSIAVDSYISQQKPDAVVIAAAKVGGIGANSKFPVEFLFENLSIQNNLIMAAHKNNIHRVLFLGSSCIYPKFSQQPIKEEYLLTGELEPTNEPYAIAKIAGIKLIQGFRKEYGKSWISAMPTNLYGPNDNFDANTSHVLPAMITKFHTAKMESAKTVELWGTGNPLREFLHVDDLASAAIMLLESYDSEIPINVGTGSDIKISDLANLIAKIVGYSGEIVWNSNMPDGTPRKVLDISRILELGWQPKINLESGIKSVYSAFLQN